MLGWDKRWKTGTIPSHQSASERPRCNNGKRASVDRGENYWLVQGKQGILSGQSGNCPGCPGRVIEIPATLSVKQLADSLRVTPVDVIKQLMRLGIMANINQIVDLSRQRVSLPLWDVKLTETAETGRKAAAAVKEMRKQQIDQDERKQHF